MSMDMYNLLRTERQREIREEAERQRRIMGWPAGRGDRDTRHAERQGQFPRSARERDR